MTTKRSNNYITTISVSDPMYSEKLAAIRKTVKALNSSAMVADGRRFRVAVRARLGRNNPNAHKYSRSKCGWSSGYHFVANPWQTIRMADAAHVDVYIHGRS